MSASKEDIERKRLAALEKIRMKNWGSISKLSIGNGSSTSFQGPKGGRSACAPHHRYQPYNTQQRNSTFDSAGSSSGINTPGFHNSKVISGSVYLISQDRFEVNPSNFSEQLINIFKTIPTKNYDSEKRLWNFSLIHYEELIRKVSPLSPHIVFGAIPQNVLTIARALTDNSPIDISKIDPYLHNKLLPFQVDGVVFGIKKRGRCLIADDMGLGKTFQALAIAHYYSKNWPLLIITTSSMRTTWESKIHELLPSVPMMNVVSISSGKEREYLTDSQAQIIIITYSMCTRLIDLLREKKFGVIVLDESHLLKSHKAQSTECVMKLTKIAKRVILLSGTPALSRPSELYTQLQIIDPQFFNGFIEFGKRYCAGKQSNFGWDMTGQSNLLELQTILTKKFLIRRTKEQILFDLKEKTRETVLLDSELVLSKDKVQHLSQAAADFQKKKSNEKHGALLIFFCETAKAKIPAICKYVSEVLDSGEKFLIFAHHRVVLEAICETLDEHNVNYICIDGATKADIRNDLVEKFQYNDTCRCAVLSITAANAGITLTAAQLVIFAELHWNPGILTQAEARAHRIGQKGGVAIKYLIGRGTADDYMWPMLENKLQVLNKVGLSKDTFQNTTLSRQDSSSSILNYFSQENHFTPGTNVKVPELKESNLEQESLDVSSFLQDEEGDEMLANIVF